MGASIALSGMFGVIGVEVVITQTFCGCGHMPDRENAKFCRLGRALERENTKSDVGR